MIECSVGCGKEAWSRGWCKSHYMRWYRYGDPRAGGPPAVKRGSHKAFIDSVLGTTSDSCIEWPFARTATNYGISSLRGRSMGAHRLVCIQAHGDPDDGQEACHNCGNPPCVNPRHLRWDTHKSNIGDKVAHGTHNRGTRHSLAKLSDADVLAIRRLVSGGGLTQAEIGEQFGISQMQVSNIHLRKQWGWLPEVEPV